MRLLEQSENGKKNRCLTDYREIFMRLWIIQPEKLMEYYRRRYVEGKDAKTRVKHIKHMV